MFASAVALFLSLISAVTFTDSQTTNGMRVLLAPDRSAPLVAVSITYDFGSRNERPGQTGVANLLHAALLRDLQRQCKEKLLIPDAEMDEACRGSNNQERTSYTLSIPADRLEPALALLAGQMRADIAGLDSLRAEILKQRQSNNDPYAKAAETLLDLSFTGFSYKHGVEGSEADLKTLTAADAQRVFRTYFAPNNAALALAGNFDPAKAKRAVEKHFGTLPRRGPFPRIDAAEPAASGERRTVLEDARAPHVQYLSAYKTVPSNHPDWYALNLLADILGQGPKSRLHRALVETKLVAGLGEGMSESRGPSLFRIQLNLPPGGSVERAEQVLDEEIARIQRDGVTEAELALARSQESDYWKQVLATPRGKAETLTRFAIYYRDPELINGELKKILRMTAADVQRVARKYMNRDNRAVVVTLNRR
ncbi:MAG TPA: pitrilysin family protein [Thermoanaerobaculia bacterium]|jgi:predicted Zn-dependent peptidase|nr:pitrilysin family protein [Thermoanaerobaculia bacterium]